MSHKRKASPPTLAPHTNIHYSPRIHDRDSTFIAAYSDKATIRTLQQLSDFSSADHRMGAWRKPSAQRSIAPGGRKIYETGHDDDGEKYGGKRLEKLLEDMQVEGSVVVARWYGGVMLGPVRFTHIVSCGRDAVRKGMSGGVGEEGGGGNKRAKIESEGKMVDRKKLEEVLAARDASISVLRGLLAEKLAAASSGNEDARVSASPAKIPNYSNMPVGALERLEKARDATLAWLLQEIDKAEMQVKEASDSEVKREERSKEEQKSGSLEVKDNVVDAPQVLSTSAKVETKTDIPRDLTTILPLEEQSLEPSKQLPP